MISHREPIVELGLTTKQFTDTIILGPKVEAWVHNHSSINCFIIWPNVVLNTNQTGKMGYMYFKFETQVVKTLQISYIDFYNNVLNDRSFPQS